MNFIKKIGIIASITLFSLFISLTPFVNVSAQNSGTGAGVTNNFSTLKNPIKSNTVQEFVRAILEGIIKIGIPLIALAIIYSGFLFVAAIGNPGKIEEAKSALINTLIGAALLLGAWGLSELIVETVKSL